MHPGWVALGIPLAGLVGLATLGPTQRSGSTANVKVQTPDDSFRYLEHPEAYVVEFDPRRVGFQLFEGWDREQEAFHKHEALAFVSGPMYERHVDETGSEFVLPLGELKLGDRIWRGRNLSAARERAFLGIRHNGQVDFDYGELTPERIQRYDTFIGGLHSVYNDLKSPPATCKGAYSLGMGQQIRYYLPRNREIYGLRNDGRLEIMMSREGLTLEQTRALARRRGLLAAYLPDHASKSRLIVPGVKGFSDEDANWISGGATSFVHVPYMLELSVRREPLRGSLRAGLAALARRPAQSACDTTPLQCGLRWGELMLDRTLAGLNRMMELGVEPLARLIWAPRPGVRAKSPVARAPFREPVITADPPVLRLRQQVESQLQPGPILQANSSPSPRLLPPAPGRPPSEAVGEGAATPDDSGAADQAAATNSQTSSTSRETTAAPVVESPGNGRPTDPGPTQHEEGGGSAEAMTLRAGTTTKAAVAMPPPPPLVPPLPAAASTGNGP